ncbi:hypothetical protein [Nocardiopsis alba]
MRKRSWRWFKVRLGGLITAETRLRAALYPDEHKQNNAGSSAPRRRP